MPYLRILWRLKWLEWMRTRLDLRWRKKSSGMRSKMSIGESPRKLRLEFGGGATIKATCFLKKDGALDLLRLANFVRADGLIVDDVVDLTYDALQQCGITAGQLASQSIVVISIPTTLGPDGFTYGDAWTICVSEENFEHTSDALFVACKRIKGTLVLTKRIGTGPDQERSTAVFGYLTITDNYCGALLLFPTTPKGRLGLTLRTPQRSDMAHYEYSQDRGLHVSLVLWSNVFVDDGNESMSFRKISMTNRPPWVAR